MGVNIAYQNISGGSGIYRRPPFFTPSDIYLTKITYIDLKNPCSENKKCGLHEVTFRSRIYIHRLYLGKLPVIPFLSSIHGCLL